MNCGEDEIHSILVCLLYKKKFFVKNYIKPYLWRKPSMLKLLSSENVKL